MTEVTEYVPGTFCWMELATTDPPAAMEFYGRLFGWTPEDVPLGLDTIYTLLRLRGKEVGALYGMSGEMTAKGIPPHWLSYVSVADVDGTSEKARTLGAKVARGPLDVLDVGRMSLIIDLRGAPFALWQRLKHAGAGLVNEPGTLCWNELLTDDTEVSQAFYAGLFGWSTETQDIGSAFYTSFLNQGRPVAGMMLFEEEWGPVPSNWLPYFEVEDCDRDVDRARAMGAEVLVGPMDIPNVGRFATFHDPQGATFSIIKLAIAP
jgi:predicted enzyme related to lactoylglutathione lyase